MLTHPEFNQETTATEAARVFRRQIQGKVVLVVGVGPESLGEAFALATASQNPASLILASRTQSKLERVAKQIEAKSPNVKVDLVVVDLSSQASVRGAASQIGELVERIDNIVNNAAVSPSDHEYTRDGIEMQFGTNHVGPFLLTNLLMPRLRNAAKVSLPGSTRIVNVTSAGHRLSPIRFHDFNFEGKEIPADEQPSAHFPNGTRDPEAAYHPFISYGQSKTANILFSLYLSESLRDAGIMSNAVHPGCMPFVF